MSNFPQTSQIGGQPGSIRMPEAMPVPAGGANANYGASPGGFFVPELSARPHDGLGPGVGFPQADVGGFGGPAVQTNNANVLPPAPANPRPNSQQFAKPPVVPSGNPSKKPVVPGAQSKIPPPNAPSGRPPNADYLHDRPQSGEKLRHRPQNDAHDTGCCGCIIC